MAASTFTRYGFHRYPVHGLDDLPVASGGLDLGRQNDTQINITNLQAYATANLSPSGADLTAMQRMGNDGIRKTTGMCMSSAFTRNSVIGIGASEVGRSWSIFPTETPTSLTCNATLCPACAAVRATYGVVGNPLITVSRDDTPSGLIGFQKLPDIWLAYNIAVANGLPNLIVCGALFAQGVYVEALPGRVYSLPANLRLVIAPILFKTPYARTGETIYRRAREKFPGDQLWFYDILPDTASAGTTGVATAREQWGFLRRRKVQGYRGGILEQLHD